MHSYSNTAVYLQHGHMHREVRTLIVIQYGLCGLAPTGSALLSIHEVFRSRYPEENGTPTTGTIQTPQGV